MSPEDHAFVVGAFVGAALALIAWTISVIVVGPNRRP